MDDKPPLGPSEVLSKTEGSPLVGRMPLPEGTNHILIHANGQRGDAKAAVRVEAYDFRNPIFLPEPDLRRLRLLHENYIRYLGARLSLFLRTEFSMKMAKLATLSYSKFTESLTNPTHICLFKAEPLVGVAVLEINPRLALTVADRLLGGSGQSVKGDRNLTEIEVTLLEDVLMIVLDEWCDQWKGDQDLRPHIIGHENNGKFLQTSPKDAIVLALTLDVTFGECSEQMRIAVPYYTIEPLIKKLQAGWRKDTAVATAEKRATWHKSYDHIEMPVRAEWDAFNLSIREITRLRVGDVIELPSSLLQETRLLLNGSHKFTGTVGLDADRVAVQVTRKIPSPPTEAAPARI